MSGRREVPVTRLTPSESLAASRMVPVEVPVAIEFNGIGYAVMMATPTDLEDFAIGFALSERIVTSAQEVTEVEALELAQGWLLRIRIAEACFAPVKERVRLRVTDSSCGLCGIEGLEQALRPLPRLQPQFRLENGAIFRALAQLPDHQPLNRATGGVHAAAFCTPDGDIRCAREDVGRHNALDKLVGALACAGVSAGEGFFLLSSRCSYELVEKSATAGCATLVTISTATSLAIDRATAAGITLVGLARPDSALNFTDFPLICGENNN